MSFFPIVQRELAVTARSRRQFRLRMVMAIGCIFLSLLPIFVAQNRGRGGAGLFGFLSGLFWLICIGSGIFLTSDSISREKREGTLGLLFLTDLKGADVILGKLVSCSLMTLLMLMSALPVLAIGILLGGVTGGEFLRVCVALLLTMFFSLSVGMFVSTFVRESGQASSITFFLLLVTAVGFPVINNLTGMLPNRSGSSLTFLNFFSPLHLFQFASSYNSTFREFVLSALGVAAVSVMSLAVASIYVPRTWQDRTRVQPVFQNAGTGGQSRTRSNPGDRRKRKLLLDQNPILWLVGDHAWEGRIAALIGGLMVVAAHVYFPE